MTSEPCAADMDHYTKQLVAFLEKKGLNRRAQIELLTTLLDISESQAYRKLNAGDNGWTLYQIHRVATHFSVSLDQLFSSAPNSFFDSDRLIDAQLKLAQQVPCKIQLGALLTAEDEPPPLVAQVDTTGWHVFQTPLQSEREAFAIEYIGISLPKPAPKVRKQTVAIIDDTDADLLAQALQMYNLDVSAYSSPGDFLLEAEQKPYDVYVLDWVLGSSDSASIIDIIRNLHGDAPPIILFTGFALQHEADLGRALAKTNVHYAGKPMPVSILAMQIRRALSQADASININEAGHTHARD